ncbi:hypothetical protein [Dysgonomonas sp. ZJ279]|uniref:hypothetical protein n=1 Tax=Dysgonomonas sp. ZJ279 TaxID=2709796 RepID=UPI0013EA8670|nr:hypothetical protein [Dysgonomonas sp. ZJ279]
MKLILLLSVICLLSCKQKETIQENRLYSLLSDTASAIVNDEIEVKPDTLLLPIFVNIGIDFLEPAGYRGTEPSDYAHMFAEEWYDFYQDSISGKYYMERAEIETGKFYDDCLDDSTTYVGSKRKSLFLIKGLRPANKHIASIQVPERKSYIWVGEKYLFDFNNHSYMLRGDGITTKSGIASMGDDEDPARWDEVINYRLYLSEKGVEGEQFIIAIPSFNYTFAQLLWLGDMDQDGKPDFIFSVSRDYESRHVVLFLSSKAQKGEIVHCAGESTYEFDC